MKVSSTLLHCFFLICWMSQALIAQIDSSGQTLEETINTDLIEDYISGGESDTEFDFNTLYEELSYLLVKPLDINKAQREDLEELRLLSDLQINDLINYRKNCGQLIALQELQAIPSFSLLTIYRLLPFIRVGGNLDDFKVPLLKMLHQGENTLFLRWTRGIEDREGYLRDPAENENYYLGDPNKFYTRFRHRYSTRLSYGFTAEKDAGEEFFKGSNKNGFDYYSAHFYLKDYNKVIKTVAIGDFNASFGQGLILYSGFGSRKGANVMNIKRSSRTLVPYRSADENRFLRGVGLTLDMTKNLDLTLFGSSRRRDANVNLPDTLNDDEEIAIISLLNSGFHRTNAEIEDENQILQRTLGASLKYSTDQFHIATNFLYEDINNLQGRNNPQPYNQFFFFGNLINLSTDYSYLYKNYNFFGETAYSSNGGWATTNGLLFGLDRNLDISLLYRNFGRTYQALNPNPLSETRGARNERGLYIGLEYRLAPGWKLSGYYDLYEHPWLRYQVDAPSNGVDYRLRLTYFKKRTFESFIELRNETKGINAANNETQTNFLVDQQKLQLRLHFGQTVSKELRLRSRLDFGFTQEGSNDRLTGFLAYQDIMWKSVSVPLSITGRIAIFDTDGYDVRFYHYENDLLYSFSIPAYYNRGSRFYLNLRYTGIRNLSIEARYARTHWSNRDNFGSGLEEIQGPNRSEVKCQMQIKF